MAEMKAGRYELLEELGRGAMGVVWKGHDPTIGRTVAVKTMKLTEDGSGLPRNELIMRFQTETRAAGLLTHPNIVVIYDAGEDAGTFYITMEYIEGQSLQALLDKKQVFPTPRILKIMEQTTAGLGYAHQHRVVHRDVKPANIMLTPEDTVKLTDFGMAKILQLGTTQTGQIVGTPSYMSPEQIKGKPIDGRSDIFALGIVLYELVTGEKPFPGQNVTTVIYKIVHEDPIPPIELDSSVHPGLNQIITKALKKEPEERYQTCAELMEDLRRYRDVGGPRADMAGTVIMVGQRRPSPIATQPMAPPKAPERERSGTLPGVPTQQPVPPPKSAAPATQPAPSPATPSPRVSTTLPPLPYTRAEPEPEKKSGAGTVLLALVLLGVIAVGGYLLWPNLQQFFSQGPGRAVTAPTAAPPVQPAKTELETPPAAAPADTGKAEEPKAAEPKPSETKPAPGAETRAAAPKSTDALVLQQRIEQRLAQAGFAGRVRVDVDGKSATLTGTLKPAERQRVLQQVRPLLAGMQVNDRLQTTSASAEPGEERPRTQPGVGEVEVVTDVMGALAVLKGSGANASWECRSPCRFEDLPPGRYTMEVTAAGFRPIKRILQVQAGHIKEERLTFQPFASGIQVMSRPAGADVFVNGSKHSEPTPTTVRLAPGSYNISVQKAGYEGYQGTVELAGDDLKQLNVQLVERARGAGYLDVKSVPPGADIFINGNHSGRKTPFVLELPPGRYTIRLFLRGYQAVEKTVVVEANKSLQLQEFLPR